MHSQYDSTKICGLRACLCVCMCRWSWWCLAHRSLFLSLTLHRDIQISSFFHSRIFPYFFLSPACRTPMKNKISSQSSACVCVCVCMSQTTHYARTENFHIEEKIEFSISFAVFFSSFVEILISSAVFPHFLRITVVFVVVAWYILSNVCEWFSFRKSIIVCMYSMDLRSMLFYMCMYSMLMPVENHAISHSHNHKHTNTPTKFTLKHTNKTKIRLNVAGWLDAMWKFQLWRVDLISSWSSVLSRICCCVDCSERSGWFSHFSSKKKQRRKEIFRRKKNGPEPKVWRKNKPSRTKNKSNRISKNLQIQTTFTVRWSKKQSSSSWITFKSNELENSFQFSNNSVKEEKKRKISFDWFRFFLFSFCLLLLNWFWYSSKWINCAATYPSSILYNFD